MSLKLIVWKFCHSCFWNTIQYFQSQKCSSKLLEIIGQILFSQNQIKICINNIKSNSHHVMFQILWRYWYGYVYYHKSWTNSVFQNLLTKFFFQNTKNQLPKAASHNHLLSISRFHPGKYSWQVCHKCDP